MGIRFATASLTRLTLSDNDYLNVVTRLSHGEQEAMYARMSPFVTPGEPVQLNRKEVRTAKVLAYLVGWSAVDGQGKPLEYSPVQPYEEREALVRNLEPDSFDEIYKAIDAHEAAQDAIAEAKKKMSAPTASSDRTSPLPFVPAGASTGSAG